ncbi:hypothetical protein PJL15_03077 [Paenarthrobacter nitroguajacolicus]|nr:hypothetical protein [Paenarthrobacter nitroguajacolicus]
MEKSSFRSAALKRRAIVPAEGYYEWQKTEDGKKIPNYLFSEKEPLLGFAGLYEFWPDPELPEDDPERWMLSCTVLTTTTQDALGYVHDRSPVIIPKERFAEWLDPDLTDKADVRHLLDSLPEPTLTPRIVSTRVNSVRNNGPGSMRCGSARTGHTCSVGRYPTNGGGDPMGLLLCTCVLESWGNHEDETQRSYAP